MEIMHLQLGSLQCRMVGPQHPKKAMILCHGYGAPGHDLVPLANEICALQEGLRGEWAFFFPEAPIALSTSLFDSRAWWHIDIEAFERAMRTGDLRDLRRDTPEGLTSARKQLRGCLEAILQMTSLSMEHIVLGGFSQGAMLTTDLTLRLEEGPAALAVLSGTLLNEDEWLRFVANRQGLRVLQAHGRQDPILPFVGAQWLRDMLSEGGLRVDFQPFDGPHTIAPQTLDSLAKLLSDI